MSTPIDSSASLGPDVAGLADDSALVEPALNDPATAPPTAPDPDHPWWGIFAGVGVTLASFAFMIALQVAFVVPYLLSYRMTDPQTINKVLSDDKTFILLSVISIIPAHLLTLALAWAVVTRLGKRPFWRSLGWGWSPRLGQVELPACLGLTILLLATGYLFEMIFGSRETTLERMLLSSTAARYSIAALATFTAPITEEVIFRGVLYSGLRKRMGVAWAAGLVIALFAAIHVPQYWPNLAAIATILLLSSVLTLVRARTGRLLPCVVIHFLFNGITSVLIVLSPYLEKPLPPSPGPTPPAPGALLDALRAAFALIF